MQRLVNFFYEYRAFFTFLLMEVLCAWMIIGNNQYQNTKFFNSSNKLAASILGFSQGSREYFSLREINEELSRENAQLRTTIERQGLANGTPAISSDTVSRFKFVSARVINNSVSQFKNYITINRGE